MELNKKHLVKIVYDGTSESNMPIHLVIPGSLHVKRGDAVTFIAENTDVILYIPNAPDLFENIKQKSLIISVPKGEESETFLIKESVEQGQYFPYAG